MPEATASLMLFIFLEASPAVILKKKDITSPLQLGIRHMNSRFKDYESNFQDPPKDL